MVGDFIQTMGFYSNYLVFYIYCDGMVKNAFPEFNKSKMRKLCMDAAKRELDDAMNRP